MTTASELSGGLLRLQAALDSMRETIRDYADELSRVEAERDEYKRRCESYEQQELGADPPAGGGRRMSALTDRMAAAIRMEFPAAKPERIMRAANRVVFELDLHLSEPTEAAQSECECARFHAAREAESERRDAEDQS